MFGVGVGGPYSIGDTSSADRAARRDETVRGRGPGRTRRRGVASEGARLDGCGGVGGGGGVGHHAGGWGEGGEEGGRE